MSPLPDPAPEAAHVQVRVIVRGRVQGVGFRFFARDLANALALRGTVCNLPDGRSVEAVLQGDTEAAQRFVEAVRRGPPGAHVDTVETWIEDRTASFTGFDIIH